MTPSSHPTVCPTQALVLPVLGVLRLLHGLVVILGRLSKCYFFLLAFPSAACGVGALRVLVRWEEVL